MDHVSRYFGGQSEVTSCRGMTRRWRAVPELPWNSSWALATGVAPVLITSALASGIRGRQS